MQSVEHQVRCPGQQDRVLARSAVRLRRRWPTTTGLRPVTEAILRPVGKPPPPRPGQAGGLVKRRNQRPRRRRRALCRIVRDVRSVRDPARRADGAWPAVPQCGAVMSSCAARRSGSSAYSVKLARSRHARAAATIDRTTRGERQKPRAAGIGAVAKRVRQRDRPQRVGRPVHRAEDPHPDVGGAAG